MKERWAIGIDLGASQIKSGLVSGRGDIKFRQIQPTPVKSGPGRIISTLQDIARQLKELAKKNRLNLQGIGIGSPGTVEPATGRVLGATPNIPGWEGTSLKKIFRKLKLPVFADNDANLMALAEHRLGAAKDYSDVICITVGTGIGGALILNGKLRHGPGFAAGELGHTSIDASGKICRCGTKGCVEAYASVPALLGFTRKLLENSGNHSILSRHKENLDLPLLFQAAGKKDKLARQVIDSEIEYLSTALANAVNLLNPEAIVIGGGLVEADDIFLKQLEKRMIQKSFPTASRNLRVFRAKLGNSAGLVGAALYCLDHPGTN